MRTLNGLQIWTFFRRLCVVLANPTLTFLPLGSIINLKNTFHLDPDPNAMAVDAFSISWTKQYVYIFAHFSTLSMVLRKIVEDEAEALVVAPLWTTQSWWPQLAHLIVDFPIRLPPTSKILYQPNNPERTHPLLKLGAFRESGKFYKAEEFRESLPTSSFKYGDNLQRNNMNVTLESGSSFQVLGKLIHFNPL